MTVDGLFGAFGPFYDYIVIFVGKLKRQFRLLRLIKLI